jgi:hypothetical protein
MTVHSLIFFLKSRIRSQPVSQKLGPNHGLADDHGAIPTDLCPGRSQAAPKTGGNEPKRTRPEAQSNPRPTMRWAFQSFEGIDILIIRQSNQMLNRQVLNLREKNRTITRLLDAPVENCYFPPG